MRRRDWLMMENWARMAGFAAFLIIPVICTFIWAISYPPLPGFGPEGEHYDCHSEAKRDPRNGATQNGIAVPPLAHADQGSREVSNACREERERLQKAANERGLAVATWVLSFATMGLFGAVAIQAALFVWQLRLIRDELGHTKTAAEAAKKSADMAERTLTEHERPWLFRNQIRIQDGVLSRVLGINSYFVFLIWKNVGRAPALIEGFEWNFIDENCLPDVPDYTGARREGTPSGLPEGESFETQGRGPPNSPSPDGGLITYVFFGRLFYKDMGGHSHVSGYAIRISPYGAVVLEAGGQAYNYYT
jgi:hypothetical protein